MRLFKKVELRFPEYTKNVALNNERTCIDGEAQNDPLNMSSLRLQHKRFVGGQFKDSIACSRRSESGAQAKNKASERFFPLFRSLSFSFALHYLNAWNRLKIQRNINSLNSGKTNHNTCTT